MSQLEVVDVHKNYGAIKVLKEVSFSVDAGETFAIIGPNGAGKTTLFKVLTGESISRAGSVRFEGRDVSAMPDFHRARLGFGRTFQVARIFSGMSVFENVVVAIEARHRSAGRSPGPWYRRTPGQPVANEAHGILDSLGLGALRDVSSQLLSHGDRKRLEFAMTLAIEPKVLMLDEPTAGMSPADRGSMVALLRDVRSSRGLTVVMTEHDMDVIFGLADRLMVLNYGEVVTIGAPEEVRHDPMVRKVYLGAEHA